MVHVKPWAQLIDNEVITPILRLVFDDDYLAIGGGGDVVLEDTDSVQWLHVDLPRWEMYGKVKPPPGIGVNFAVHDIDCHGGPMRLVPGTHTVPYQLESMNPASESQMLEKRGLSRVFVCPLHTGDAILRDLRLWHAGSANRGPRPRHLPNAEFLAGWYAELTEGSEDHLAPRRVLPPSIWRELSPHAQRVSERALADEALDTSFYKDIALPQQFD